MKPDGTSPLRPVSGFKDWLISKGDMMIALCFCRIASRLDLAESRCGGHEGFPTVLAGCIEHCPSLSSEVLQNLHAHTYGKLKDGKQAVVSLFSGVGGLDLGLTRPQSQFILNPESDGDVWQGLGSRCL